MHSIVCIFILLCIYIRFLGTYIQSCDLAPFGMKGFHKFQLVLGINHRQDGSFFNQSYIDFARECKSYSCGKRIFFAEVLHFHTIHTSKSFVGFIHGNNFDQQSCFGSCIWIFCHCCSCICESKYNPARIFSK